VPECEAASEAESPERGADNAPRHIGGARVALYGGGETRSRLNSMEQKGRRTRVKALTASLVLSP